MAAANVIERQYSCRFCSTLFNDKRPRRRHINTTHPLCHQCLRRFDTLELLQSHQRETSHLFCHECNLHFPKLDSHLRHVRDVSHTTHYQCCDCGREYTGQHTLGNHCCDCDRAF